MGADNQAGTYLREGKPLGSNMAGKKYPVHLDTPVMIGWTIGGRVLGRVTHPSTIPALGGLPLGFPWDPG